MNSRTGVILIVIYNHQYNDNIDKIESIYRERFSRIFHIIPFYTGSRSNVIPIYENSFYFNGYVAQAAKFLSNLDCEHYMFIGDDLFLNPAINEKNYDCHFNLQGGVNFVPEILVFQKMDFYWYRTIQALIWEPELRGVEVSNQLPTYEEAKIKFEEMGYSFGKLKFMSLFPSRFPFSLMMIKSLYGFLKHFLSVLLKGRKFLYLSFPLVGGYSDIFIVNKKSFNYFSHLCGVFATVKLFVEIAIPTAIILSSEKIVTEKNLELKGKALWNKSDFQLLDEFSNSLESITKRFPKQFLYIHPLKLSKWK